LSQRLDRLIRADLAHQPPPIKDPWAEIRAERQRIRAFALAERRHGSIR